MTTIVFEYSTSHGQPATGNLTFTPTRRVAHENGTVLPQPFAVGLDQGRAEVKLEPNTTGWIWQVREQINTQPWTTNYYTIPDRREPITFHTLRPIDPSTIGTNLNPEPAWWAHIDHVQASAHHIELDLLESREYVTQNQQHVNTGKEHATTASHAATRATQQAQRAETQADRATTQADRAQDQADRATTGPNSAKVQAELARDAAIAARDETQTALTATQQARNQTFTARDESVAAQQGSETARDEAVTAQQAAETARDEATTGPNNAADRAEAAATTAESARDDAIAAATNAGILTSPNGTEYQLTVDDEGNLSTTPLD